MGVLQELIWQENLTNRESQPESEYVYENNDLNTTKLRGSPEKIGNLNPLKIEKLEQQQNGALENDVTLLNQGNIGDIQLIQNDNSEVHMGSDADLKSKSRVSEPRYDHVIFLHTHNGCRL